VSEGEGKSEVRLVPMSRLQRDALAGEINLLSNDPHYDPEGSPLLTLLDSYDQGITKEEAGQLELRWPMNELEPPVGYKLRAAFREHR
jgi:hypothetical protein